MSIIPPLPFTLQNGTTADASQVQADLDAIRNNVNLYAAPVSGGGNTYKGAVVTNSTDPVITSGNTAYLSFDTDIISNTAIHSTITNNSRLTVPAGASIIRLNAQIFYENFTAGERIELYYAKNRSTNTTLALTITSGSYFQFTALSPAVACTPGDYFEFLVAPISSNVKVGGVFEMQILQ